MAESADFLIIGGGVCGLTLALELRRRHGDASIRVLEKETSCGQHASGRNSGVLHAGFYYTADSLKARFTRDGCREMKQWCEERDLAILHCGKLVVAQTEDEADTLKVLLDRGRANGVELEDIDLETAREIEPRVRSAGRCLWSPSTSSVDPVEVMSALVTEAERANIEITTSCRVLSARPGEVVSDRGKLSAGYIVNAAGLYADKIAQQFGFAEHYTIMPFKGLYLEVEEAEPVRTHIYPVPNIRNPFLGVHYTVSADRSVTLGPTAIPAFWREHYTGLGGFRAGEMVDIVGRQIGLAVRNDFNFRQLALDEMPKYFKSRMVKLARGLATPPPDAARYRWRRPGIRAQLIDTRARKLEMDFVFEGDRHSFHVLNAVSPAFTCSLPFSRHLADQIDALLA